MERASLSSQTQRSHQHNARHKRRAKPRNHNTTEKWWHNSLTFVEQAVREASDAIKRILVPTLLRYVRHRLLHRIVSVHCLFRLLCVFF